MPRVVIDTESGKEVRWLVMIDDGCVLSIYLLRIK